MSFIVTDRACRVKPTFAGSREAFTEIYEILVQPVLGYLRRMEVRLER